MDSPGRRSNCERRILSFQERSLRGGLKNLQSYLCELVKGDEMNRLQQCVLCAVFVAGIWGGMFSVQTESCEVATRAALGGRKSVTVSAGSESEAIATAERQNAGWKAISARKVNPKDPNSRFWEVVMVEE